MNFELYEVGATVVPLVLTIEQEGVGGVTGKSPTVALRNASTTNSYLDWADNTFKVAGWTTKYASMSEVERGHYQRVFNSSLVAAIADGTVVSVEFHVDDGASVIGDDADVILFTAGFGGGGGGGWDDLVAAHQVPGSFGELVYQIRVEEEEDDFRVEPD